MDAASTMSSSARSHNLFQVFLRLRPSQTGVASADRFLAVERPASDALSTAPTHITLNPPNDRRRAIEKFCFTRVFEEDASQLDVFHCTNVVSLVEGVLAPHGGDGTDALLATLGVTGSGKTHTILGSRSQRGLTQLALDVIFRSLGSSIVDSTTNPTLEASIDASDASEAAIYSAQSFLDAVYADPSVPARTGSRAPTPLFTPTNQNRQLAGAVSRGTRQLSQAAGVLHEPMPLGGASSLLRPKTPAKHFMTVTASVQRKKANAKTSPKGEQHGPPPTPRRLLNRPSAFPQAPDIHSINVSCDPSCEYAVVISMYEVYNDRIFDLLTPPTKSAATKEYRRRPLLFKSTELSPDRKVVAGLRKVICSSLSQALMVLEAGLHERRVAGTGSNSVSSRSHGFFCVEVKKRSRADPRREVPWRGSAFTIVDLAGSERARDAKTAGATLAEAGKINESLMYLGQCLQLQSDAGNASKPNVVPFRQCKLTELLFSNSFPSQSFSHSQATRRNPQRGVMIVTADPHGDFNATSQILRYSALAREITVPRIPSITQTILQTAAATSSSNSAGSANSNCYNANHPQPCSSPISSPVMHHNKPFFPPGANAAPHRPGSPVGAGNVQRTFSPVSSTSSEDRATMELAALEIARLAEEVEYLRDALAHEQDARLTAEAHLLSMEERTLDLEQAIREDCVAEFEQRLAIEQARWKAGMQVEMERSEEHCDRKIELFAQSMGVQQGSPGAQGDGFGDDEASEDKENVLIENLEQENERLRRELAVYKRELAGRSPTKRRPLADRDEMTTTSSPAAGSPRGSGSLRAAAGEAQLQRKMEALRVSDEARSSSGSAVARKESNGSPKKMRKLAARRWDSALGDDDLF